MRGYVNNKHELTSWGKFLQVAFEKTTPSDEQAQSIFVIIELARLGLLDKAQLSSHNQEGLSKLGSSKFC